jgi:hypothetical protein
MIALPLVLTLANPVIRLTSLIIRPGLVSFNRLISIHCNYLVDGFVGTVSCLVVKSASSSGVVVVMTGTRSEFDHHIASLDIGSQVSVIISRAFLRGVDRLVSVSSGDLIGKPHI